MAGITISDRDPVKRVLTFDLRDLLNTMGDRVRTARWRVADLECTGGSAAERFHDASDVGRELDGAELIDLANNVGQIIDGEFTAFLPGASEPWVVITAVDSSAFHVITDDADVISGIKHSFSRVDDLPEPIEGW